MLWKLSRFHTDFIRHAVHHVADGNVDVQLIVSSRGLTMLGGETVWTFPKDFFDIFHCEGKSTLIIDTEIWQSFASKYHANTVLNLQHDLHAEQIKFVLEYHNRRDEGYIFALTTIDEL